MQRFYRGLPPGRVEAAQADVALEQRLDRIWMDGVDCWLINPNTGARSKTRGP